MHVWLALFSLLLPNPADVAVHDGVSTDGEPLRYRGIEALLAKFDAEAESNADAQNL
jgi:hypothetical protein